MHTVSAFSLSVAGKCALNLNFRTWKALPSGANFIQYIARSFAKSLHETGTTDEDAAADKTSNKPTLYEVLNAAPVPHSLPTFLLHSLTVFARH